MMQLSGLPRLIVATFLYGLCFMAGNVYSEGKIFDHSATGFELSGPHALSACENCHVGGQFGGTPRNCEGCHSINGRISATPKPPNHISTSEQCDSCHQEVSWQGVVLVDHTQVMGPCLQCHNNTIVSGQSYNHIPTDNKQCSECHSDMSWLPVQFVHDESKPCVSCHNNFNRDGQPPYHILTQLQCEGCHKSTRSWAPVLGPDVDHDLVRECYVCHGDGGTAKGQPEVGHPITGQRECSECHGTVRF